MLWILALLTGAAQAASLDILEIGGPWGTPAATDSTAVWWNPAGLAAGSGTRFQLEVAPTLATVHYDRVDPYGFGGQDTYRMLGPVPFLGAASDFGVDGLGLGFALTVPMARGGGVVDGIPDLDDYKQTDPIPPESNFGRYHVRSGTQQVITLMAAGGYEVADRVAFGGGILFHDSTWGARADTTLLPQINDTIRHEFDQETDYTDAQIEDPRYGATLDFHDLKDVAISWNAGLRAVVVPDRVVLSATYASGFRVAHTGDMTLRFSCPPESDALGRFGAESMGTCYANVRTHASLSYDLPQRVMGSVQVRPVDDLTVELMGGWVDWSVYDDFEVLVTDAADLNDFDDPDTAGLVEQERLWARDNHDSGWVAVDVKGVVAERWTFGGRAMLDLAAVPDHVLSPNNYDTTTLALTGLAAFQPTPQVQIGASLTQHLLQSRTVTDSAFGTSLGVDHSAPEVDRYFYPHSNGTYSGSITRAGVAVRLLFGEDSTE